MPDLIGLIGNEERNPTVIRRGSVPESNRSPAPSVGFRDGEITFAQGQHVDGLESENIFDQWIGPSCTLRSVAHPVPILVPARIQHHVHRPRHLHGRIPRRIGRVVIQRVISYGRCIHLSSPSDGPRRVRVVRHRCARIRESRSLIYLQRVCPDQSDDRNRGIHDLNRACCRLGRESSTCIKINEVDIGGADPV